MEQQTKMYVVFVTESLSIKLHSKELSQWSNVVGKKKKKVHAGYVLDTTLSASLVLAFLQQPSKVGPIMVRFTDRETEAQRHWVSHPETR